MKYKLTDREFEIMQILWDTPKPLLASEIAEKAKIVSNRTVFQTINQLLKKNYIKTAGQIMVKKAVSKVYAPAITRQEYNSSLLADIFSNTTETASFKSVLMHFTKKSKDNNSDLISELKEFLDDYEQELDDKRKDTDDKN